jgi:hypothetical protein
MDVRLVLHAQVQDGTYCDSPPAEGRSEKIGELRVRLGL